MKIYVQQNDQKTGPFSPAELREKTYSGELPRSIPACLEGGTEWLPLDKLLAAQEAPNRPAPPPPIAAAAPKLRDRKEKTALTFLYIASVPVWLFFLVFCIAGYGIPLVVAGVLALLIAFGELWFMAYLKTNAVRVSDRQLPDVHRAVQNCCQRLGLEPPDVYIIQHNVWNAFATKIFGRRMVVLFSGAVDSILLKGDLQQLTWLIGHELGHHWAGHLNWSQKFAKGGSWLIWLKLWHSRRAELTCDRVGLFCAGSLKASQLALMNATVGAQLAGRVNLAEAAEQWQEHHDEFFVRYRTLYATHPHLLARLNLLTTASTELGIAG